MLCCVEHNTRCANSWGLALTVALQNALARDVLRQLQCIASQQSRIREMKVPPSPLPHVSSFACTHAMSPVLSVCSLGCGHF